MKTNRKKINFGFTDQVFDEGIHICQIYSEEDERHNALIDYIVTGVKDGDCNTCFSENESRETLARAFASRGMSYDDLSAIGCVSLSPTAEVYFKDGAFDPDRMLALMEDYYRASMADSYTGARVIGEMSPQVESVPGGSRLLEYEARISLLLKKIPLTAVCQYDARQFDGATIMDILKVHPYTILKGRVVNNPFYIEPEEYLQSIQYQQ